MNKKYFEGGYEHQSSNQPTSTMADIEKKVENLTLNAPAPAAAAPSAEKPQGKPKEKKAKKPVAEGSYPLEVLPPAFNFSPPILHDCEAS